MGLTRNKRVSRLCGCARAKHEIQQSESDGKSREGRTHQSLLAIRCKNAKTIIIPALIVAVVVIVVIPICTSTKSAPSADDLELQPGLYDSCVITLDKSMPENMTEPEGSPPFVSTFETWSDLIASAKETIDIASYYATLRSVDVLPTPFYPTSEVGEKIIEELIKAGKERGVKIRVLLSWYKVESYFLDFTSILTKEVNVEMRVLDPKKLFGCGIHHGKFVIVDREHFYIGSANFGWRAMTQKKEIGVTLHNCSTLANDVEKVFETFWQLAVDSPEIPEEWDEDHQTSINAKTPLPVRINDSLVLTYIANSPPPFCPKGRTSDLESILDVIGRAEKFIYISMLLYLPENGRVKHQHYWPVLDNALREAIAFRGIQVRLLAYNRTDFVPRSMWYLKSLNALRSELFDVDVRLYTVPFLNEDLDILPHARLKHERYVVTDNAAYVGNSNWSEDFFNCTTSISIVFRDAVINGTSLRNPIREDLLQLFNADWNSEYSSPMPTVPCLP